ncbi:hypothetical protein K438DRAFT_416605 [Mycena galopus ATCC 62051]|nr:hypothetical protein K438DRAFT_416605 [Mycena galopus ATCC 62051]
MPATEAFWQESTLQRPQFSFQMYFLRALSLVDQCLIAARTVPIHYPSCVRGEGSVSRRAGPDPPQCAQPLLSSRRLHRLCHSPSPSCPGRMPSRSHSSSHPATSRRRSSSSNNNDNRSSSTGSAPSFQRPDNRSPGPAATLKRDSHRLCISPDRRVHPWRPPCLQRCCGRGEPPPAKRTGADNGSVHVGPAGSVAVPVVDFDFPTMNAKFDKVALMARSCAGQRRRGRVAHM